MATEVTFDTVCNTIADAIRTLLGDDWNVDDDFPKSIVPPAIVLKADDQNAVDYHTGFSSASGRLRLILMLFAGQVNERPAEDIIRELISPGSDLIQALENVTFDGFGWVRVDKAGKGETALGGGRAKMARLALTVQT